MTEKNIIDAIISDLDKYHLNGFICQSYGGLTQLFLYVEYSGYITDELKKSERFKTVRRFEVAYRFKSDLINFFLQNHSYKSGRYGHRVIFTPSTCPNLFNWIKEYLK